MLFYYDLCFIPDIPAAQQVSLYQPQPSLLQQQQAALLQQQQMQVGSYRIIGYSLRSSTDSKIQLPKPKLEIYKKSFHFSGPEIWNNIPIHIRNSKSLKSFKDKCFLYLLSSQWVYYLCFHYSTNAECYDDYYGYVHICVL